ncbi:MAG: 50S ribosomal protein L4 [Fimbriimonas sp.]|nr:50S ribosomal protein L4 [Fimbriimonas sp.]
MAELQIHGKDGKSVGTHSLSAAISGAKVNAVTAHRAVVSEEANKRQGTQSALTRSEVRGGGRKPYKQKKTGNARQGTVSAPHYTHGGMAMAVKPRDYEKKINKKERRAALLGAFAAQIAAGNVTIVDSIVFAEPKTKDAVALISALGFANQRRLLIVLPVYDAVTYKCFRNLPNVTVRTAPSSSAGGAEAAKTAVFSTRDLLLAQKIVVAQDALTKIEEVWAK